VLSTIWAAGGGGAEQLIDVPHWRPDRSDWASLVEHRSRTWRGRFPANAIPLARGVDMVISAWVEHLPTPARTFREVARLLSPGGAFIFDPNGTARTRC
jgi:SAM-dependent methyltransferase